MDHSYQLDMNISCPSYYSIYYPIYYSYFFLRGSILRRSMSMGNGLHTHVWYMPPTTTRKWAICEFRKERR